MQTDLQAAQFAHEEERQQKQPKHEEDKEIDRRKLGEGLEHRRQAAGEAMEESRLMLQCTSKSNIQAKIHTMTSFLSFFLF